MDVFPSSDWAHTLSKLSRNFGGHGSLFPRLNSLHISLGYAAWEELADLALGPCLTSLTVSGPEHGIDSEVASNVIESLRSKAPEIEDLTFEDGIHGPFNFNPNWGTFAKLRRLAIWDISFQGWRTLEACGLLEEVVMEFCEMDWFRLRPYAEMWEDTVTLAALQKLVIRSGTTDRGPYPYEFTGPILVNPIMPSLRSVAFDLDLWKDDEEAASEVGHQIFENLGHNSTSLHDATMVTDCESIRSLMQGLSGIRELRKLSLAVREGTLKKSAQLDDEDMEDLTGLLPYLRALSLIHVDGPTEDLRLTEAALKSLVRHCRSLTEVDLDLDLSAFNASTSNTSTVVSLPTLDKLRIHHLQLSEEALPSATALLSGLFPNVSLASLEETIAAARMAQHLLDDRNAFLKLICW